MKNLGAPNKLTVREHKVVLRLIDSKFLLHSTGRQRVDVILTAIALVMRSGCAWRYLYVTFCAI